MLNNPKLFQDPHLHYPIDDTALPFAEYITKSAEQVAATHLDLQQNKEKILKANTPFELRPTGQADGKSGALLIHGLFDSPLVMQDIGLCLQKKGLLVRSILLPGHGTVPGGLLNVSYTEWLQAVRYGVNTLEKEVEKIFLVGFSTGALLALHHALNHSRIAGLILIAPAFKINSCFDFLSGWYPVISWAWPRAQWLTIKEENDYAKYQSITFNSVWQVYSLARLVKHLSKQQPLACPSLFVASMADKTVSTKAILRYYQQYSQPNNHILVYQNLSHISIPISPDNTHYGEKGDYSHPKHIPTFNPEFAVLTKEIETFIDDSSY